MLTLVCVVPLLLSLLVARDPSTQFVEDVQTGPLVVRAVEAPGESVSNVTVTVVFDDQELIRTRRAGRVTWLPAQWPRQNGAAIIEIDGAIVYGHSGTTPFYRRLGPEMEGEDVAELIDFLGETGFLADGLVEIDPLDIANTRFSPALASAVRDFSRTTSSKTSSWFDPSWVAWVQDASRGAERVVEIGDDLVVGDSIYRVNAEMLDLSITDLDTGLPLEPGPVTITSPVLPNDLAIEYPLIPLALAEIADMIPLPEQPDEASVIFDALAKRAPKATDAALLPISAVVADRLGDNCVLSEGAPDPSRWRTVNVVTEPSPGILLVSGVAAGETFAAQPAESISLDFSCP